MHEDTDYWVDVRAENNDANSSYSGDLATSTLAGTPDATVDANAGLGKSIESCRSLSR